MSTPWTTTGLATESDVEQKFIYPLLSSSLGLGLNAEEIRTKTYLAPFDIDKGAGKKVGYYPDYAAVLSSLPLMVVEAKSPKESAEAGFREGQLYATEINKRFPPDVNPCKVVIATNGVDLLWGLWDHVTPQRCAASDITPALAALEDLRTLASRDALLRRAAELRATISTPNRLRPIDLIGGSSKQHAQLPPNRFASELVHLLKVYFDPDATRSRKDIVTKAYSPTSHTTKYDAVFEALLKDNLSRVKYQGFSEIETSKSDAPRFDEALARAISQGKATPDALVLLVGSVGAGKSMFIDRYYLHLMGSAVKESTLWTFVDFNQAPADLTNLDSWIADAVLEDFPRRNNQAAFYDYKQLERYFAPDILARRKGPYRNIVNSQPQEYERLIAADIAKWVEDKPRLLRGIMRFFIGDKAKRVVVVFDNGDRRDREQQLRIFQAVQHFRSTYGCFCVLALRDVTYDRYQNEPPLDAFFKPFAFRITPPRFLDVVRRRLDLIIADLTEHADKKLQYMLPNGVYVEYPATELGQYLVGVYSALFLPTRNVRTILEGLANSNIRNALQMFSEILMSGHLTDDRIFSARYDSTSSGVQLPEWLVLRILMRTKYQYFTEPHGYVTNVFDVDTRSATATNFLIPEVLALLSRDRRTKGELGIEGFRLVQGVVEELASRGFVAEDVLWALGKLIERGLVVADHQRMSGVARQDYVKISAGGHIHLHVLMQRFEYLNGAAMSTPIRDHDLAASIAKLGDLVDDPAERDVGRQFEKLRAFREALIKEGKIHKAQSVIPEKDLIGFNAVKDSVEAALNMMGR